MTLEEAKLEATNETSSNPDEDKQDRTLLFRQGIKNSSNNFSDYWSRQQPENILEKAKAIKAELENESFEQDIRLRKNTLLTLFIFLAIETAIIFTITFFQGFSKKIGFYLEEWSFRLLVTATITQITIMLLVAVKYLFPKK